MRNPYERSYCFTARGEASLFEMADQLATPDNLDAGIILRTLKEQIHFIPFSDYLRRYVYLHSGMTGSFRKVETETYVRTVLDAFRETGTPGSLRHPGTRLDSRVRSWFEQTTVRRDVVLLLGFGLSMPAEDVNTFLTRAIHGHRLDEDDPFEALCAYCYRNGYRYARMAQLWHTCQQLLCPPGTPLSSGHAFPGLTDEESQMIRDLANASRERALTPMTQHTRDTFDRLYREVSDCLLKYRFPDGNPAGQISPHDLEEVLYSSIPRDLHGNLVPELRSTLRDTISGKRFSRQHIHELLQRRIEPTRYDLITLAFLLLSLQVDREPDPKSRYLAFRQEVNSILTGCGFEPLYTADPYDCFILICVLSVDPLGTCADVLELSYTMNPADE